MIRYMQLALIALMMMFAAPALAAPPDAGADATAEDAKSPDAEGEAKAAAEEAKEGDAKAEPAKGDGDGDDSKEAKAEEAGTDSGTGTGGEEQPAELKTDEEAGEAVEGLYGAIMSKNWALALSLGLMLLVFVARKVPVLDKIPAKATPWVAAAMSMLGYVAAALMAPGAEIGAAILSGLSVGAGAVGLWEMVFKHILSKKEEA